MRTRLVLLLILALSTPALADIWKGAERRYVTEHNDSQATNRDRHMMVAQKDVRGLDFDVYIRLQTGMSEGELLLRAGKPDSESVENTRNDIVKTYYYFPTIANPWITAITLRGGKIANIERTKKTF